MTERKALRRRCDLPACGKQYRYKKKSSRTCSPACRQRLYMERRAARQAFEREQIEAKASARAARMVAQTAERERQVESHRQPAPAPTPSPPPAPPAPDRYTYIGPLEPPPQVVTIRYRKPYTTPI